MVPIPVTVLDMSIIASRKSKPTETDGYVAVQLSFGSRKASRVNKAQAGHFYKGVEAGRGLRVCAYRRAVCIVAAGFALCRRVVPGWPVG